MPPPVLHEVGMRDGLQMEALIVPTEQKIAWVEGLLKSGIDIVQLGAFIRPERVPQMADTDRLFGHFTAPGRKPDGVTLSGLVLNERGLERGLACGAEMLCLGISASETHSLKNTRMSTAEATRRTIAIAREALGAGKRVQVSVQSAFGCGYEGPVPRERVLAIVKALLDAGLRHLSLADTAGHAYPEAVETLFADILALDREITCACHFHDTYGLAMANCYAARRAGVTAFEGSVAGLGGCPFTRVGGGNTCTEDLVHALQRSGVRRDVDLAALVELARGMARFFGRELPGAVYRTGSISTQGG